jgi:hypothetical protein
MCDDIYERAIAEDKEQMRLEEATAELHAEIERLTAEVAQWQAYAETLRLALVAKDKG